jgi:multidrug efflux system outer membrane protein
MWQLTADVAANYFTLREQDAQLTLARSTLQARKQNLDLVQARFQGGIANLQDVRQAEQSYYEVSASIPVVQRAIALTEDTLSTLIGSYPGNIPRGLDLEKQIAMPPVPPAGIPSQLLTRRPDIIQAEDTLAAASANVDVARSLLYPQISIAASAGGGGLALNSVFYGPAGLFSVLPQLVAPLFNGGSLKANVRLTQAQREQVATSYLQTVQKAMQEVSDAVVSYDRLREYSDQADLRSAAAVDSLRLANLRYQGGVSSYLEVLDSETRSYSDQLDAVQAHLNERLALVQLYLALGGGWQQGPTPAPGS